MSVDTVIVLHGEQKGAEHSPEGHLSRYFILEACQYQRAENLSFSGVISLPIPTVWGLCLLRDGGTQTSVELVY